MFWKEKEMLLSSSGNKPLADNSFNDNTLFLYMMNEDRAHGIDFSNNGKFEIKWKCS